MCVFVCVQAAHISHTLSFDVCMVGLKLDLMRFCETESKVVIPSHMTRAINVYMYVILDPSVDQRCQQIYISVCGAFCYSCCPTQSFQELVYRVPYFLLFYIALTCVCVSLFSVC